MKNCLWFNSSIKNATCTYRVWTQGSDVRRRRPVYPEWDQGEQIKPSVCYFFRLKYLPRSFEVNHFSIHNLHDPYSVRLSYGWEGKIFSRKNNVAVGIKLTAFSELLFLLKFITRWTVMKLVIMPAVRGRCSRNHSVYWHIWQLLLSRISSIGYRQEICCLGQQLSWGIGMFPLTTEIPLSSLGLYRRVEPHCAKLHRMGKLCFYAFLYRALWQLCNINQKSNFKLF